jgi:hypothetical protein
MTILQSLTEHTQRAEPYANDGLRLRLSGQVLPAPSIEQELRSIMAERDAQDVPPAGKQAGRKAGKHARKAAGKHARRTRGRFAP